MAQAESVLGAWRNDPADDGAEIEAPKERSTSEYLDPAKPAPKRESAPTGAHHQRETGSALSDEPDRTQRKEDAKMKQYQSHKVVRAGKIDGPPFYSEERAGYRIPIEADVDYLISVNIYDRIRSMAGGGGLEGGYLVEYADGYVSWSPAKAFEDGYTPADYTELPTDRLNFGQVIEGLKRGRRYERVNWNGRGMFIYLVDGSNFTVNRAPLLGIYPEGTEIVYRPHIDMRTADGECVPWFASQSDMLAEDWIDVTDEVAPNGE